jgi:uracil-DNA glycosylase family 4
VAKKNEALAALKERLRFFDEIGADFVFKAGPAAPRADVPPSSSVKSSPSVGVGTSPAKPPAGRSLEEIAAEIRACKKCGLAAGRILAVPGEGNPRSPLLFVGEGPGHEEDVQGRPFVGRAGQLLTKIIAAMGYDRSEVFIANIVKCRPPENRVPHRDEAEACAPFLLEQIAVLNPRVIVTLGKTAADFFLPNVKAMSSIRGVFQEWRGSPIMPTFHPSYLIRNEGNKEIRKMVWDDMRKVMAFLAGD